MQQAVGIIGLGIMGSAIAANLAAAGLRVVGYDTDPNAAMAAQTTDIEIAATVEAVAAGCETVLVCLPSAPAVMATAHALSTEPRPRVVAELSTLSLDDKEAFRAVLEARGHMALDCPLSGTGAQAKTRDLVVFASGDAEGIARTTPVFLGFSRSVRNLGGFGNGTKMKLIANLLVAIHNVAAAEAMVLAKKAGLDADQVVDVIGESTGASRMFQIRAPLMARGAYTPATMRNRVWKKDMAIIGAFASELTCPTPLFTLTNAVYDAAVAMGYGEADTAAVAAVLEVMAGCAD